MMKIHMLLSLATCVSLITSVSLPVIAETVPSQTTSTSVNNETVPNAVQPASNQTSAVSLKDITLAKNTAIIISFPTAMTVNVSEKQDVPLTVFLNKAIKDNQGNLLVPENSPVSIILKPTSKGAKIIAQSLVVNGQVLAIKASSPTIPSATITHKTGHEKAEQNESVWGKIGESAFSFANQGKTEESERGAMLGRTLGLVAGLNSPKKSRVVKIAENSIFVLSLEATVNLSSP